jgi:hypothetical protein
MTLSGSLSWLGSAFELLKACLVVVWIVFRLFIREVLEFGFPFWFNHARHRKTLMSRLKARRSHAVS